MAGCTPPLAFASCIALLVGCVGAVGDASPPERMPDGTAGPAVTPPRTAGGAAGTGGTMPAPGAGGSGAVSPAACTAPRPGAIPMRRLTRRQYLNSVRDLFGSATDAATAFPETAIRGGFRTFGDANTVTADGAEQIAAAALAVAQKATANLATLLGCTPGTGADDACARAWAAKLARRAYRRPPDAAEIATLEKVYADLRTAGATPADAAGAVIEAVLQSPQFLYLSEVGRDPAAPARSVVPLTDHEIAARLSFALWNTLPDGELSKLADDGKLRTREAVEAQARRLLADRRAEPLVADFVDDWLELYRLDGQAKDPQRHPEWNAAFAAALRAELTTFATEVAFRGAAGDRTFATLLGAPWTMASSATAAVYGAARPASAAGVARVELDAGQRAGMLTSGAFLAAHAGSNESLPVVRGAMVRQHLLCTHLEVPPGLNISSPTPDPKLSTRQRFAEHSENAACAGCHALMDPIGFGLENYDPVGRWRTTEANGARIDGAGELRAAGDATGPFTGGAALGKKLAASNTAAGCFARQMFSYLNARRFDDTADACALGAIEKRFLDRGGDLHELLIAVTASDPFLYRLVPERGQ